MQSGREASPKETASGKSKKSEEQPATAPPVVCTHTDDSYDVLVKQRGSAMSSLARCRLPVFTFSRLSAIIFKTETATAIATTNGYRTVPYRLCGCAKIIVSQLRWHGAYRRSKVSYNHHLTHCP